MIEVEFWGVRGTLPVPGKDTIRYGGNTNCITVKVDHAPWIIFDAGTGIKKLSDHIIKNNLFPFMGRIFITHPHWDHINGLPYFMPFYIEGNQFDIFSATPKNIGVKKLIFGQMNSVYFPVSHEKIISRLKFHKIHDEQSFNLDNILIKTMRLSHPGHCIGYRLETDKKSICYITDNEIYLENSELYNENYIEDLIQFINKTDLLIIDSTYTDDAYLEKISWGHSSVSQVVNLAEKAKVRKLCLFHHDPSQTDRDIDFKLKQATLMLKEMHSNTICIAPREGDKLIL